MTAEEPPSIPSAPALPAARRRRRPRDYLAVGAAAVLLAGGVLVATSGTDEETSCIGALLAHVPADEWWVRGADLAAARDAGYDDSSIEAMEASTVETGIPPDPVFQLHDFWSDAGGLPHEPGDVECWAQGVVESVARRLLRRGTRRGLRSRVPGGRR